eukprot:UN02875
MIPKNVFQTYESKDLSNEHRITMSTWQRLNPEYNFHFYTDNERRKFLQNNFHERVYKAYIKLLPGALRADT